MGSELDTVFDKDTEKWMEYWKHRFDLTNIGHSAPLNGRQTYNIWEQWFKCGPAYPDYEPENPIEFHSIPTAGACSWPDPPGGNWSEVLEEIVEETATEASKFVDLIHTSDEIYNAYKQKSFDSQGPDSIEFNKEYKAMTRTESSHGVHFSVHTVPGAYNTVKIESGIADYSGLDKAKVAFKVDITDDNVNPLSKAETTSHNQSSLYSRFDQMSKDELHEIGVIRVYKSDLDKLLEKIKMERRENQDSKKITRELRSVKQTKQRLDFEPDGYTYIKSFSMDTKIKKEKSDSNIAKTEPAK